MHLVEGDICNWQWKEGHRKIVDCYSHRGVFRNGSFYDTYWHSEQTIINLSEIELTFLGNINNYEEILHHRKIYYDPSDIIDMRHANDSHAPVLLKKGAKRSAKAMLEYAMYEKDKAISQRDSAERRIQTMDFHISLIDDGRLDEVCF